MLIVKGRKLIVNNDIRLKEIGREAVETIFTLIDKGHEYTGIFVDSYIKSDRTSLICYQNQFVGLTGLKDTDFINKNRNRLLIIRRFPTIRNNYLFRSGVDELCFLKNRY